jgi:hypothetical protein
MPSPQPSRVLFAAAATAAVLLLAGAALVHARIAAADAAMDQRVEALQASWAARSFARPSAWGTSTDGEAFEHYEAAARLATELLQRDEQAMIGALRCSDEELATTCAALLARWRPVVDALRAGAQCGRATPPPWPLDGGAHGTSNLLACRWIANAAVFTARAARHEGRFAEAVRHTLDAAMFGADIARHGATVQRMIGGAVLAIGASEAWPDEALARLDRPALDLLAAGLARIDDSLPPWLDQDGELLLLARSLREQPAAAWDPPAASWRYAFSPRWEIADAFLRAAHLADELARQRGLSWPLRKAAFAREVEAIATDCNQVAKLCTSNLVAAEGTWREILARLRLLRLAVDHRRDAATAPLGDPLADGPLTVAATSDGLRLASLGAASRPGLVRFVR